MNVKDFGKRVVYLLFLLGLQLSYPQTQKEVTIFWDSSSSMMDREVEKEFYFLEAYFKNSPNAKITLVSFSNTIIAKELFDVADGDWSTLKERLSNTRYDGATSYQNLEEFDGESDILVFTDGKQTGRAATPSFTGNVFVINASKDFNRANINLLTLVNNGNYVNLLNQQFGQAQSGEGKIIYSGTIYEDTRPIAGATVFIKGKSDAAVQTNAEGQYEIESSSGETLVMSVNNKLFELPLGEKTTNDFFMEGNQIRLDEVVVSETRDEPIEEITTGYGTENKEKIGYAVQSIGEDDISDVSTTASNATQGKFSGVRLGQNDDLTQVVMRPSNSILGNNYGLIVIDGVPMSRSNSSTQQTIGNDISRSNALQNSGFIDPKNIAKITVLKGLAATNRFGSMGANGVLLITTKTGTYGKGSNEIKDLARLTDNIFDGKLQVNKKSLVTPYLKELKQGKSVQEAYEIYLRQKLNHTKSPEYFIDVYDFFKESNENLAIRILSNVLEKERPSYEELRAFYLKCSELEYNELALLASNRMLELYPDKAQPYFDFARANRNSENYQLAVNTLSDMLQGTANPDLNFEGLQKVAGTELRNLVNLNSSELVFDQVDVKYRNNLTYGARLVFEWHDADAEFVLQFVNPAKRFFDWEHTALSDRKRIQDELRNGFATEQFEIFGAESKGDWQVNVTYMGNGGQNEATPLFLKCTAYYNFGSPDQQKESYLIRLHEKGEKQLFFKFTTK